MARTERRAVEGGGGPGYPVSLSIRTAQMSNSNFPKKLYKLDNRWNNEENYKYYKLIISMRKTNKKSRKYEVTKILKSRENKYKSLKFTRRQ